MRWLSAKSLLSIVLGSALSGLCATAALAVTVSTLYEATASTERGRDAALQEALRTVAMRVSGRRDAGSQLGALNNPRQYMRFESTNAGVLTAGFDSGSVDKLLADAGLPIWGKERPLTVIWMQVMESDGSSRWLAADYPSPERDAIARAAQLRGLPIVWPRIDMQQQATLQSGVDSSALLESTAAYGANAALLGRARRDAAGGFSVQWTLAAQEGNASASGGLEEGVHLAADTFARAYAAAGDTLVNVLMEVSGLASLEAYAETLNYLEGLTLVRAVALEEVAGEIMRFRLTVRGDAMTLRRAIALGNRLSPVASGAPASDRLAFRYQP